MDAEGQPGPQKGEVFLIAFPDSWGCSSLLLSKLHKWQFAKV
jgi:hypothetical protein